MPDNDERLMQLVLDATAAPGTAQAIGEIVRHACEMLGAEYAGITLRMPGGRFTSIGITDQMVARVDQLQYELKEGPCVDAAQKDYTLYSPDVGTDPRWPRWGPRAAAMGLHGIMSAQLQHRGRPIGGLNLFGAEGQEFGQDDAAAAHLFAVHAAAILGAAQTEEQLRTALETRTVIGQAEGIIMERFGLDAKTAFSVLSRYSQNSNVKLHEVALELVETRQLPAAGSDA